jgi:hypothetical protein
MFKSFGRLSEEEQHSSEDTGDQHEQSDEAREHDSSTENDDSHFHKTVL